MWEGAVPEASAALGSGGVGSAAVGSAAVKGAGLGELWKGRSHLVAREGVGDLLELGRDLDLLPLLGLDDGRELALCGLVRHAEELGRVLLQLGGERRVGLGAQVRHVAHELID